jgi:NTE family protein
MQQRSIFDGIPQEELQELLAGFERRRFAPGSVVLAEGDSLFETYVVESGAADVFVADSEGQEHRIGFVAPGGTLGEMSMFTGEPAAGTVRAATDLDVYVIGEADFEQLATRYPLIYRNIGAILSERLDRSNRRPLRDTTGRATILRDWGAPPFLGYAIACSIAWHLRQPTLLLILDESPPEELRDLVRSAPRPRLRPRRADRSSRDGRPAKDACADVMLLTSVLDFVTATLTARIEDLHPMYEHVLVQVRGSQQALAYHARTVHLVDADGRAPVSMDGSDCVVRAWAAAEGPRNPSGDGVVSVPQLDRIEVERLRTGLLPSGTAAGDALGWIARDLCGLKVGLALGGGSAKGYAHLGALRVLLDAGLPIDYLAGTSIGAAIAGFYALGFDMDQAADEMDRLGPRAFRPHLSMRSLLSTNALRRGMRTLCGETRIEDLPVPLALTAADISNGQEIVFRQGLLWPAVLASMAIPGIFPAQRIGNHTLVDGGVFHPVPSNVVAEMGADVVIGVRLMQATEARAEVVATEPSGRVPSIFGTIVRSVELMQSRISARTASTATILITPMETEIEIERIGLRRWKAARQYIALGEAAAEAALPRLAAALPWMRRLDGAAKTS